MLRLTDQALALAFTIAAQDLNVLPGIALRRRARRPAGPAPTHDRLRPGPRALVLGFLLVRTEDLVWLVYVLLALTAVFAAAFEPASMAAMPNLVRSAICPSPTPSRGRCGARCWP
jgi:hypothetical protein